MYETILVPTDGSAGAEVAIDEAMDLAERFGATLHTLYVVDTSSVPTGLDAVRIDRTMDDAGHEIVESVAERGTARDLPVETAVERGVVHRSIVDYARDNGVDLIVMGTHGRQGIERYLLGSVTEKVVRTSDVPVLTVQGAREANDDGGE